jgi:hypothetical protein
MFPPIWTRPGAGVYLEENRPGETREDQRAIRSRFLAVVMTQSDVAPFVPERRTIGR